MPETFVPMGPALLSGAGSAFTPLPFKPAPFPAGKPAPAPNGHALAAAPAAPPPPPQNCPPPKVTLQRQGDTVSAIRIQCPCGQVIELSCVY
jgi:hypothetical protein